MRAVLGNENGDLGILQAIRTHYPDTAVGVASSRAIDPFSELTPRETEVLRRIAAGQNTATMASEMRVTTATLRTYVKNVLAKLGAHSRLEAAALASRWAGPDPGETGRADRHGPTLDRLTPREREVLYHFTTGTSLREVARHLHMAQKTVNTHLQKIRSKLGVHSTLEAVALARSQLAHVQLAVAGSAADD
jgi:DNA-binding NarL/FixJ family response regulator